MLFISHVFAAVYHLCSRVVMVYLGRVMEEGSTDAIFAAPHHPYTRAVLAAAASLKLRRRREPRPCARLVVPAIVSPAFATISTPFAVDGVGGTSNRLRRILPS
jgi:ABC-type dipeptide/oligopeptide/nickel transport system ATPase component